MAELENHMLIFKKASYYIIIWANSKLFYYLIITQCMIIEFNY